MQFIKPILLICIIAFFVTSCNHSNESNPSKQEPIDSLTAKNKAIAIDFFTVAFVKKDVKGAFDKYIGEKYIQHNPNVPDGKEKPIEYLSQWLKENPQASCEIKRVIAEGNLVVIHSHWKDSPEKPGQAGVDIFRIENGKIVEHWDVLQDVPAKSANDNTVF